MTGSPKTPKDLPDEVTMNSPRTGLSSIKAKIKRQQAAYDVVQGKIDSINVNEFRMDLFDAKM